MLSTILYQMGHEVHWFSSSFHHYKKEQRCNNDTEILIKDNFTIHLIKTKGYKNNVSVQRINHHRTLARKFNIKTIDYNKPDIILVTLAPLELSKVVVNYGEQNKIPVIVDIRDLWPEIFSEVIPKWGKGIIRPYIWMCKKRLKSIIRRATAIIGVTPNFLEYGLNVAGLKKRQFDEVFFTSYKPRDLTNQMPSFKENWGHYGLKQSDFIVTFVGNFGKQFVLNPIIEAAEKLKEYQDIKFVLCGSGETLQSFKNESKHLDNIILTGWIEESEIHSLLSATSIGIAPYRNSINFTNNTPNKFGEYLSAGLPVILGVGGIMEDLVRDYKCGDIYKDSEELAKIIKSLYFDNDLLKSMSVNAYKLYEEKFNSDKVYPDFAKYLEKVALKSKSKIGEYNEI